ncbi:enoyl-CoA hydratase [Pseudomonas sp. X10]
MNDLAISTDNGVLTIAFNRPQKKNALTAAMYQVLASHLQAAAEDRQVRVVLVHGDPDAFCAGNDLGDFLDNPPQAFDAPVWAFLRVLSAFPKPVVAAVSGVAVGVGTTMLLHCDLVYAADNARFSLPFVNLGLCPEAASSLLLPRVMGYPAAAEALLTGEAFDADVALQANLVSRVLPVEQLLDFARLQAGKIADKPAAAVGQAKRLLKMGAAAEVRERIDEEARVFGQMVAGPEAREAFSAFTEKRKPDFSRL